MKYDKVKLEIMNWKTEYKRDIETGKGFLIAGKTSLDKNKKINPTGIYSPKYGTSWSDEHPFAERYTCSCGALMGRIYDGEICNKCQTKVKFVDSDLNMTGWLKLEKYHLIHPVLFHIVRSIIGTKQLDIILDYKRRLDVDGKQKKLKEDFETRTPYDAIGMVEFKEKFDEIIDYFYKKNKKKTDEYKMIIENRQNIFVKHIPVFTLLLRPIMISGQDFNYAKINNDYARLQSKIFDLNQNELSLDKIKIEVYLDLYNSQKILNKIHDTIMDMLSTKDGHIRGNMLGGRFNFSSRNVIIPLTDKCKMNEVILPYMGFLELFRPDLINLMMKMEKIDIHEAIAEWNYAKVRFSKKIYELMNYLINNVKGGLWVLINRKIYCGLM